MKTNHYKAKNALTYIRHIVHTMTWEIPEVHSKQVTYKKHLWDEIGEYT